MKGTCEGPFYLYDSDMREKLLKPVRDIRRILLLGYPKFVTIRFVADHFQLNVEERHILTRIIVPPDRIASRISKKITYIDTRYKDILLDGYNVLLSVDSLLRKKPIWLCDDGYVRDTRCYFSKAKQIENLEESLGLVIEFLCEVHSKSVIFLLDAQISRSGELAGFIRYKMEEHGIPGEARISKTTDFELKSYEGRPKNDLVVATSDGIVIDSVSQVIDIPAFLMEKMGIEPIRLY